MRLSTIHIALGAIILAGMSACTERGGIATGYYEAGADCGIPVRRIAERILAPAE